VKESPTYRSLGDHTEALQVEYDPSRITYEELLDVFWSGHDPGQRVWSRQYMAAVFTHGGRQKRLAEESRDLLSARSKIQVTTAIIPAGTFTPAEGYHQKYYLRRQKDLLAEYRENFGEPLDLIRSTAAARLNGYYGGYGTGEDLEAEIDSLGLSLKGKRNLRELVQSSARLRACPVKVGL
jgi:peptide-methionine (S)-S-oxide reductase